ncbi:MAG TPA: amidophosphoribosyltransferase [Kiritimatiellia bacterium]|nr:amidophosphoribosyltransferase [Kiritimatiellia bacterium]HRU70465.1 amidophosphoribosyltransferase [Kiritimatiellia bacterium]
MCVTENSDDGQCGQREGPRESCGVVAVYGVENAALTLYNGLFALQHRGQEGAGMVVSDGKTLHYCKGMGLVSEVFTGDFAEHLPGHIGIGHVRYSTTGASRTVNVQPFLAECRDGMWAIAHNGNLVNAGELRDKYQKQGAIFQTTTDSEILLHQLADPAYFGQRDRIRSALAELCGSFAFVIARPHCVYAARDPWGIRPLSLGKLGNGYIVASETCALQQIGAEFVRDVNPGELVKLDENGVKSLRFADVPVSGYGQCVFEQIYFARPNSHVFGQSVYTTRIANGRTLAREQPCSADVVVPIPDSGVLAALGFSHESGIPFELGFIRNHYVGRTFIMPSQRSRSSSVDLKLAVVPEAVAGKRVVVVDDSIIRGNTIQKRIDVLRRAGAREVHVRIACPPTRHPCYFGIDFPETNELVAAGRTEEQICALCGADSVGYLSLEGLKSSLANSGHYCYGCFTGRYVCGTEHVVCKHALERSGPDQLEDRHHRYGVMMQ